MRCRLKLFNNSIHIPGSVSVNDFCLPSRLQEVLLKHKFIHLPNDLPHDRPIGESFPIRKSQLRLCALLLSILPKFAARGMASPVRLLHRVQVVLDLLHFSISVFQEVSVNSFPVNTFLMAIRAVTAFSRACSSSCDWVCNKSPLCLFTHILTSYCCWPHTNFS